MYSSHYHTGENSDFEVGYIVLGDALGIYSDERNEILDRLNRYGWSGSLADVPSYDIEIGGCLMFGAGGVGSQVPRIMLEWYDGRVYSHIPKGERDKNVPEGSVLHVSYGVEYDDCLVNSFPDYDPRNGEHNKHLEERVLSWVGRPRLGDFRNVLGLDFGKS